MRTKLRFLLIALFMCASVAVARQAPPPAPAEAPETPVEVVVEGHSLFSVSERVLSFSPQERADAIRQRIIQLLDQPPSQVFPIRVVETPTTSDIVSQDLVIMAVTDADARLARISRQALAAQYAELIQRAITDLRNEHSIQTIALGALYTLLATIALILIIKIGLRAYRRTVAYIDVKGRLRLPSFRIQKVELVSSSQLANFALSILYLIRAVLGVLFLYVYVSVVFGFFPQTRGYAAALAQYAYAPIRSILSTLIAKTPDFIFVVVVIVISYYLTKLVKFIFGEIGRGRITFQRFYPDWADPTYKIVRFVIIAMTLAIILPSLPGYQSPALQGVSLFVGVLFSLSSTAAISNIVAGLALTYTRGFQVGDRVQIGETTGDVVEKTLLVTRVRTIKNVDISIPNSLVLANHMVNYSSSAERDGLILHTTVTIGYDAPWQKVQKLLIDAALATPNILADPAPFVLQTSLDDSYVSYELNAYTRQPRRMAITYSALHENIQDGFNRAGVEIMSPQYSAIRDGNDTTIPEANRGPGYTPGAFRIRRDSAPRKSSGQ
ncbi:MAG TPA: mechanosensitive ion channel family protein [Terriglobia bacterium]|nr:mechanosensitive ion channel family protein [Terriglobia bacterium]